MTDPAIIARFKIKTLALIDTLHVTPEDVLGLGMTLAVAFGHRGGLTRQQLHDVLDGAIIQVPTIPGAAEAMEGAARNRAAGGKA